MIRLALTVLFLASAAFAGSYTQGNGGHIVVCATDIRQHHYANGLTLLDLAEGNVLHGFTYRRLESIRHLSIEDAFTAILDPYLNGNFALFPPDYYLQWFSRRNSELDHKPALSLFPGSWSPFALPPSCRIDQGAIQYVTLDGPIHGEVSVQISDKYWNDSQRGLTNDLKAALLFHEYTYRYLRVSVPTCPQSHVRVLTSFLLSDQALMMTAEERYNFLQKFSCRDSDRAQ